MRRGRASGSLLLGPFDPSPTKKTFLLRLPQRRHTVVGSGRAPVRGLYREP
ncbi:MAG TPA: hypothetical protein VME69_09770 [Methylocella sp.]|nr:hypothetical protein [Methylocella sp.]